MFFQLTPLRGGWPLRLRPLWDCHLMTHADKSWITTDDADRNLIWRKAGYVTAIALHRGRAIATCTQKKTTMALTIEVKTLTGWIKARHLPQVRCEAEAVAQHFGLDRAAVTVA